MTKSSHTPGPWHLVDDEWDGIFVHAPQSHKFVCEVTVTNPVYTTPGYDISKEEALANARFIAAAPKMLGALQQAEKALDSVFDGWIDGVIGEALLAVRIAIAEATGEERIGA